MLSYEYHGLVENPDETIKENIQSILIIKAILSPTSKGKTRDEMIESINILQNRSRDLGDDLQSLRTSLENLQEDVLQEERRQERIRKEKEEEQRRKEREKQ